MQKPGEHTIDFSLTANHPFGGIVLGSVMLSVRPDAKIIANHLPAHHRPASLDVFE